MKKAALTFEPLLFEIGTEELPADYIAPLAGQLEANAAALFRSQHIAYEGLQVFATPRRLLLYVEKLADRQLLPEEEIRGPSTKAAYDAAGKPTKALEGFVRSRGAKLSDVKVVDTGKGAYIYIVKPPQSVAAVRVLPDLLRHLIESLRAPKTMRWDAGGARFARPVRWLAAFWGAQAVPVRYGKLRARKETFVGGPLRTRPLSVNSADTFLGALKKAGVCYDPAARKRAIEQLVEKAAKKLQGRLVPETEAFGLLDEVCFLCESPVLLSGGFDPEYLGLPREVLLASMAKHQRVFALQDAGGEILPNFVAILEGTPGKPASVKRIFESILNARLADSLLFWEQDRKQNFAALTIEGVAFHQKLGSMADKSARVEALSHVLAECWSLDDAQRRALQRACILAKRDLVTTMVKEFPTLQGVMGKHYALASGEAPEVAEAIEAHYLPLGNRAPQSVLGSAAALLDKWDTLCSYFGLGIEPTGDQDPFGLRRAVLGIIEIIWRERKPFPLRRLFDARVDAAPDALPFAGMTAEDKEKVFARIRDYLLERLYNFTWSGLDGTQPAADVIDAVRRSDCDDLHGILTRVLALQSIMKVPGTLQAAKVIERTGNILRGARDAVGEPESGLFRDADERLLWEIFLKEQGSINAEIDSGQYAEATLRFGEVFHPPLNTFFENVLVNDPDEGIRQNRLALLKAIHTLYTGRVADLSQLRILENEELA